MADWLDADPDERFGRIQTQRKACPLCDKEGNPSTVRKHMRAEHPEVPPGTPVPSPEEKCNPPKEKP